MKSITCAGMCAIVIGLFIGSFPASVSAGTICATNEQRIVSDVSNTIQNGGSAVLTYPSPLWGGVLGAQWIWKTHLVTSPEISETAVITKTFELPGPVASSTLDIAGDDYFTVYINGSKVISEFGEGNFLTSQQYTLEPSLFHSGGNEIKIEVINAKYFYEEGASAYTNPAGVSYALTLTTQMCVQNGGQGMLLNRGIITTTGSNSLPGANDLSSTQVVDTAVSNAAIVSNVSISDTDDRIGHKENTIDKADIVTPTPTWGEQENNNTTLIPALVGVSHPWWKNGAPYVLIALIIALLLLLVRIIIAKKEKAA